jgi:hypothetical protein
MNRPKNIVGKVNPSDNSITKGTAECRSLLLYRCLEENVIGKQHYIRGIAKILISNTNKREILIVVYAKRVYRKER